MNILFVDDDSSRLLEFLKTLDDANIPVTHAYGDNISSNLDKSWDYIFLDFDDYPDGDFGYVADMIAQNPSRFIGTTIVIHSLNNKGAVKMAATLATPERDIRVLVIPGAWANCKVIDDKIWFS